MMESPKQEDIPKLDDDENNSPTEKVDGDNPSQQVGESPPKTGEESSPIDTDIGLRLGDIIEINAPMNKTLDKHIFVITYCDPESQITIVDTTTLETRNLFITDGKLNDESIIDISLLNRDERVGYARQNSLLPNTWITINFCGDVPATITGLITNLEEDMIEVQTYPERDTIYIDFGYKGIPKEIPISQIVIRDAPQAVKADETAKLGDLPPVVEGEEKTTEAVPGEEEAGDVSIAASMTQYDRPSEEVKQQIKDMLIDADQISFGDDLEEIEQVVNVSDDEQRYGIDSQTNDLLDEMLSTIPSME